MPPTPVTNLPPVGSAAELDALRADPTRWVPAVEGLARELGLGGAPLHDLGGGNLVVAVGDAHVLKLTPPRHARDVEGEVVALAALAGRSWPGRLRAPALLGRGMWGGWLWALIERLPGVTLKSVRDLVPQVDRVRIARSLGGWLAALHADPRPDGGVLTGSCARYVARERPLCIARQAGWGVPATLCEELEALLVRVGDLAACPSTLLHADLHDDNVLVEERDGRFEATGIIDFGDSTEGEPLFDLVTPVGLVARGDGAQVRALFDGAGLASDLADPRRIGRFVALSVLHRWNDLTRVKAWAPDALRSLETLTAALLGEEGRDVPLAGPRDGSEAR